MECSDFGEGLGPWELFFYLHLAHNGINHHILSVAQKVQKTERVFSTFSTCFSNEKYFWKSLKSFNLLPFFLTCIISSMTILNIYVTINSTEIGTQMEWWLRELHNFEFFPTQFFPTFNTTKEINEAQILSSKSFPKSIKK